jgi:hypothetical protein
MNPAYILYFCHLTGEEFDTVVKRLQDQKLFTRQPDALTMAKLQKYIERVDKKLTRYTMSAETGLRLREIKILDSMKYANDQGLEIRFVNSRRKLATPDGVYLIKTLC